MNLRRIFRLAAAALAAALILCGQAAALSAKHAVVMDAATGKVLYEREANERCLIASTTKIMTGLIICEECDLSREISVPPEAAGIEGSSVYLKAGERVCMENLLYGMMLQSGNDAAASLAIAHSGSIEAFAHRMNERAQELDLHNTHFANPHGLDAEENYSTAEDLARLAAAAMENDTFARVVSTRQHRFGERVVTNHNKLLWRYEGAEGVKTGFTKKAGRILVSSATRQGRRLICVTINAPDDWNDHASLLDEGFSQFESRILCRKGQIFGVFTAPSGNVSGPAAAEQDLEALLLPEERVDAVRVHCGSGEGYAEFFTDGRRIGMCPLKDVMTGENDGRTHPEDHSLPGIDVPPEGGGTDP